MRYALRANTAASAGGAASAWAPRVAPSARPAEAYACPLPLGDSASAPSERGAGRVALRQGGCG